MIKTTLEPTWLYGSLMILFNIHPNFLSPVTLNNSGKFPNVGIIKKGNKIIYKCKIAVS